MYYRTQFQPRTIALFNFSMNRGLVVSFITTAHGLVSWKEAFSALIMSVRNSCSEWCSSFLLPCSKRGWYVVTVFWLLCFLLFLCAFVCLCFCCLKSLVYQLSLLVLLQWLPLSLPLLLLPFITFTIAVVFFLNIIIITSISILHRKLQIPSHVLSFNPLHYSFIKKKKSNLNVRVRGFSQSNASWE